MTDLFNKIVGDRGSLENLLAKIPGFQGYMEMSSRREADRMIREHVAQQFQAQITRYAGLQSDLVRKGGLLVMDKAKSAHTKLENLRRRIATDTPGYSGFFASNKIGADELQNVYAFDEAMVRYADQIAQKLDLLQTAINGESNMIEPALSDLEATLTEASQAYDLRDNVLKGIG